MRTLILGAVVLGGLGYLLIAPVRPVTPVAPVVEAKPAPAATPSTHNRSLIVSLKRQIAEEKEALERSIYNYRKGRRDVTRGSESDSIENRARRARIEELETRLSSVEGGS